VRNFINIVESKTSFEPTGEESYDAHGLYAKYGQPLCTFSNLPPLAQKSVSIYMEDCGVDFTAPKYLYGYAIVPMQVMKDSIMRFGDLADDHDDFDSYHEWYRNGPDMENHQQVYPIILGHEIIQDGWHRFHDYVRKGLTEVPTVWCGG
jgi:hypothetical protein